MYIVKRSEKITETLRLQGKSGDDVKDIDIVIDVDVIASDFVKKRDEFIAAQRRITAIQKEGRKAGFENAYIEYGKTLLDFLGIVFGKENVLTIADFFDDNYIEMMTQLFPFINERIVPAVKRSIGYTKKQLRKQWSLK